MSVSQKVKDQTAKRRWFVRELLACGISMGDIARFLRVKRDLITSDRNHISDYDIITRDLPDRRKLLTIIPIVQARLIELKSEESPENPRRHRKLIHYLERWLQRYARLIPQSSLYGLEIISLAKHLRLLGIPWESITDLTGVPRITIRAHLKKCGEHQELGRLAAQVYDCRFETVFVEYAKTHTDGWVAPEGINDIEAYRALLAKWLRVDAILANLQGYMQAMQDIYYPNEDKAASPYRLVLTDLGATKHEPLDVSRCAQKIWNDFLALLASESVPAPADQHGCLHYLQQQARKCMPDEPAPQITQEITRLIDDSLAQLDEQGCRVACLHYGLWGESAHSHTKIGTLIERSRQRSHQILKCVLSQLLLCAETKLALALMQSREQLQATILEYEQRIQSRQQREIQDNEYPFDPWVLTRDPNNQELSVRTRNCLYNAKINTIRQLVLTTPVELMRLKGFGRKCLNEVEAFLEKLRLRLGMLETELPPEGIY